MNSNDNAEETSLTDEDHRQFFELELRQYAIVFGVVFVIVTGFFYWFINTMEANANKKVQQAKSILERAEDAPDELNPLTVELETMVSETEHERNWILDELTADSFANRLDNQLKDRYLNATARLRLPPDWKQRLPQNIQKWANQKRQQRRQEVKSFLERLDSTVTEIKKRIQRVEEIRKNEDIQPGKFGGSVRRYLNVKSTVLSRIRTVEDALDNAEAGFDLPKPVFDASVRLIDPLTKLALHFRGFSALTAAPSAYYHAERLLHDALRIDPQNPAAYYHLGVIYRELNMGPVAGEHKIRALKWDPTYKRETIVENFRDRLDEKPSDSRRRYDLAWALYETGQLKKAEKHLKEVLKQEFNESSMVKVLARKRLNYIRQGEPPYNKLTNF